MQVLIKVLMVIVLIVIIAAAGFGLWQLERTIHYKLSYKSMVEQTVRDMVKAEALRSPAERNPR